LKFYEKGIGRLEICHHRQVLKTIDFRDG